MHQTSYVNVSWISFVLDSCHWGKNPWLIHFKEEKLYFGAKFQGFRQWSVILGHDEAEKHHGRERRDNNQAMIILYSILYCTVLYYIILRRKEEARDNTQAMTVVAHIL